MEMLWEGDREEEGAQPMQDDGGAAEEQSLLPEEEAFPGAAGVDVSPGAVLKKIETLVGSLLAGLLEPEKPTVPPLQLTTNKAATLERRLLNVREAPQCVRLWRVLAEAHRCDDLHSSRRPIFRPAGGLAYPPGD